MKEPCMYYVTAVMTSMIVTAFLVVTATSISHRMYKDIYESTDGHLPIVVIEKGIEERMASTVRHNRARGKHNINGMANIVFNMYFQHTLNLFDAFLLYIFSFIIPFF